MLQRSCARNKISQRSADNQIVSRQKPKSSFRIMAQTISDGIRRGEVIVKNWEFLQSRRQNHLNTLFNRRKNKLQALSKVNREFYQKLNTQESYYGEKETIGAQSVKNEFGIDSIRKSSDDLLSLGKYALKISESRECLSHNSAKMIMSKLQVYNNKENAGQTYFRKMVTEQSCRSGSRTKDIIQLRYTQMPSKYSSNAKQIRVRSSNEPPRLRKLADIFTAF